MSGVQERLIVRREPLIGKVCPVCGTEFLGLARQRYCRPSCLQRASYLRHAQSRRAARRARYWRQKQERAEEGHS
jgi:hypothetical protein